MIVDPNTAPVGMTIIAKPTHNCNLCCKYCYVDENAAKGFMDEKTLESILTKASKFTGKKRVNRLLWQGGEPLSMGLDFYKRVAEVEKSLGEDFWFTNHVQTNGTLLNSAYLDFFAENLFKLGVSLDGPKEIHDSARVFRTGQGSFDVVFSNLLMAREWAKKDKNSKYLSAGVISVFSRISLGREDELYDFFKENKIPFQLNTLLKSGNAKGNWEGIVGLTAFESARGLMRLFDRWYSEPQYCVSISNFENLIGDLKEGKPSVCRQSGNCQKRYISFDPLGDAYPCTRFMGEKSFRLGNINEKDFHEINNHPVRIEILNRRVEECSCCKYVKICNSGCPSNAYFEGRGFQSKDPHCVEYITLMDHICKTISPELDSLNIKLEGINNGKKTLSRVSA